MKAWKILRFTLFILLIKYIFIFYLYLYFIYNYLLLLLLFINFILLIIIVCVQSARINCKLENVSILVLKSVNRSYSIRVGM